LGEEEGGGDPADVVAVPSGRVGWREE
jgi:hypothetical protein